MRILMLNNEFPPLGGGMGTTHQAVLRLLAGRAEFEIDVVTAGLAGRYEVEAFAERVTMYRVPVWNHNLHHSTNRELILYAAQALPLARNLHRARRYDFCLAWSALPAGAVALALRRLRLAYLVWVSGPDIPGFERRYRAIYPLLQPLIRATWRGAAAVIAKCAEEVEMIHAVDSGVDVTVIPNGVDLEQFHAGNSAPDTGPLRVICAARLIERKGQQHLIEAVRRLADAGRDVRLVLVGTGDMHAALVEQARRMNVAERVEFAGYVPREEIAGWYRRAHVFALPSFNEGLSLAALEGLAAGLPLVLSRTGGTRDLVEEGVNGLTFEWADVATLARHLELLDANRALVRQMAAASRRRAARFGWPAITARFVELFEQVGAEGAGVAR